MRTLMLVLAFALPAAAGCDDDTPISSPDLSMAAPMDSSTLPDQAGQKPADLSGQAPDDLAGADLSGQMMNDIAMMPVPDAGVMDAAGPLGDFAGPDLFDVCPTINCKNGGVTRCMMSGCTMCVAAQMGNTMVCAK
jgi:hypothetical protein